MSIGDCRAKKYHRVDTNVFNLPINYEDTHVVTIKKRKPNIGQYTLTGHDDACAALFVLLKDILSGELVMAFQHPYYVSKYFKDKDSTEEQLVFEKLCIITFFSRIRNIRLIRKINTILEIKNLKLMPITPEMEELESDINAKIEKATSLGINPGKYLSEENDATDVSDCTNEWCLGNRKEEPGRASDTITIIKDFDGDLWLMVIIRKCGPGTNNIALPGGFNNSGESFLDCAEREAKEETDWIISMPVVPTRQEIPATKSFWSDPRACFPEGMINGGSILYYDFFNSR